MHRFKEGLNNLYSRTSLGYVDFLGELPDWGDYRRAVEHSVVIDTDVGRCRILDIDALIEIKTKVGRPHDLRAVKLLRAIKEKLDSSR